MEFCARNVYQVPPDFPLQSLFSLQAQAFRSSHVPLSACGAEGKQNNMETKDFSAKELQELAGAGEPEKVCICDNPYAEHPLRYHQDDCPFFEDYSNSESGYVY